MNDASTLAIVRMEKFTHCSQLLLWTFLSNCRFVLFTLIVLINRGTNITILFCPPGLWNRDLDSLCIQVLCNLCNLSPMLLGTWISWTDTRCVGDKVLMLKVQPNKGKKLVMLVLTSNNQPFLVALYAHSTWERHVIGKCPVTCLTTPMNPRQRMSNFLAACRDAKHTEELVACHLRQQSVKSNMYWESGGRWSRQDDFKCIHGLYTQKGTPIIVIVAQTIGCH